MKVIIPIHGISMWSSGYSEEWKEALIPPSTYLWKEFWWDKVNDSINKDPSSILKSGRIDKWLIIKLWDHIGDVFRYRFLGNKKEKAKKMLKKFLLQFNDAEEIVILAHSLGSVLIFETLCEMDPGFTKKIKLTTFGSPLTMPFERWFLGVKDKPIYIAKWINLYGTILDVVGGRPLKNFSNFNEKNNFFVKSTHDEIKYLIKGREIIFEQMF